MEGARLTTVSICSPPSTPTLHWCLKWENGNWGPHPPSVYNKLKSLQDVEGKEESFPTFREKALTSHLIENKRTTSSWCVLHWSDWRRMKNLWWIHTEYFFFLFFSCVATTVEKLEMRRYIFFYIKIQWYYYISPSPNMRQYNFIFLKTSLSN